jgi:hypothetical protein
MRKFSSTKLKVCFRPSNWTPKVRRGHSTILLKFWITALLKLRILSANLRRGPRRSEVDWGAWTGWSWHQVVWEHWLEGDASGSNWTGNGEEILKEKKSSLSATTVLYSCKSPSGTPASPVILLDIAADGQTTFLQIKRKCRRLKLSHVC